MEPLYPEDFRAVETVQRNGYELRTQRFNEGTKIQFDIVSAFTLEGHYIGDEKDAKHLIDRGIKPELADRADSVCSIGFCDREQKWYGWSHRAICGFGIGHVVQEGDEGSRIGEYEGGIYVPVGFIVQTLEDAKRVAGAFAEDVS